MPIERTRSIRVPMTEEELAMLHALAEAEGTSAADVVRAYVRKAYAKKIGSRDALEGATKKPRR